MSHPPVDIDCFFFLPCSYLSVFCEVQRPLVCLLSCDMYIEKVYLAVPVNREVVLYNQSLIRAHFKWKQVKRVSCNSFNHRPLRASVIVFMNKQLPSTVSCGLELN